MSESQRESISIKDDSTDPPSPLAEWVLEVTGSKEIGGFDSLHVLYRVDVRDKSAGDSWCIYRRYSDFEVLFKYLTNQIGKEEMQQYGLILPGKQPWGSILSTLDSVINQRKPQLERFLHAVQQCKVACKHKVFEQFLDKTNKGASGVQVELGEKKILKEAFASTKYFPKGSVLSIWRIRFVVILKSGTMFILNSMYHNSSQAVTQLSLNGGGVKLVSKADRNGVVITSAATEEKLCVNFTSAADAAFWIRALSDFTLNSSDFRNTAVTAATEAETNQRRTSQQRKEPTVAAPQNIRAQGTGRTEDELSTMLGV